MRHLYLNICTTVSATIIMGVADMAFAAQDPHDIDIHGASAAAPGLPQLDPTWYPSQIFWLLVIFALLYLFYSKNILPTLSGTLENRHEHIQGDLDTAERLKEEAEDVHQAYNKILQDAREKSSRLYQDIENSIKEKTASDYNDFQERVLKEIQLTEIRIDKSKKEAMKDMTDIVADIASEASQKIIGQSADPQTVRNVVNNLNDKAKAA